MSRNHVLLAALPLAVLWTVNLTGERSSLQTAAAPQRLQATATANPVQEANRQMKSGALQLARTGAGGYLKSVLSTFAIPVESQLLVFSETSLQSRYITPSTPRALFFNDHMAVGWVRDSGSLELVAFDPQFGVVFYTLAQNAPSQFARDERCLQCHLTPLAGRVPGWAAMSMLPLSDNRHEYAQGWPVDHRTPFEDRWGGWYVTGAQVPRVHLGNVPVHHAARSYVRLPVAPALPSLAGRFDISGYLTPHSDVVAQLVFNHQVGAINLIARLHAAARTTNATPGGGTREELVRELVDYLLFIDEASWPGPVRGSSGFAEVFASHGARDARGRSLRDLDLNRRLMRYPCSYMIDTPVFEALPEPARAAVYARLWEVLSGRDKTPVYGRLLPAERRAIVEILRDTKAGLPDYFR